MDQKWMSLAAEAAMETVKNGHGTPFGAAIVCENELVCTGANVVYRDLDPTAHAETVAIRAACAKRRTVNLSDCVMYATGQPCPMCVGAILLCGIKTCYYDSSYADAERNGYGCNHVVNYLNGSARSGLEMTHQPGNEKCAELWRVAEAMMKQKR